jgi:hypothetical protein
MSSMPWDSSWWLHDEPATWTSRGRPRRVPINDIFTCQDNVDYGNGKYDERRMFDPVRDRPTRSKKRGVLMVPQAGLVKVRDSMSGEERTIVALANGNHRFMQAAINGVKKVLLRMCWTKPRRQCPLCGYLDPSLLHFHQALSTKIIHRVSHGEWVGETWVEGENGEHHAKTIYELLATNRKNAS